MTTLVIVEHEGDQLKAATLNAVTAAQKIGGPVHLLIAGHQCAALAQTAAKIAGVDKVRVADAHPGIDGVRREIGLETGQRGLGHTCSPQGVCPGVM